MNFIMRFLDITESHQTGQVSIRQKKTLLKLLTGYPNRAIKLSLENYLLIQNYTINPYILCPKKAFCQ